MIDWDGAAGVAVGCLGLLGGLGGWVVRRHRAEVAEAHAEGIAKGQESAASKAASKASREADMTLSQRLDAIAADLREARAETKASHAQLGRDLSGLRETQAAHSVQLAEVRSDVRGIRDSMATVEERRKATSERVAKVEADAKEERRELWTAVDDLRRTVAR